MIDNERTKDGTFLFTAIAPNITFSHCRHHRQTIEVTERDARTLKWTDIRDRKQFICDDCGQPFSAQGGKFDYAQNGAFIKDGGQDDR
jgi:ABC-type sugar transport system ATPase subunit